LGFSDFGLNDTTSALNQQSDIRDLQSNDPVATARGSDTKLGHRIMPGEEEEN